MLIRARDEASREIQKVSRALKASSDLEGTSEAAKRAQYAKTIAAKKQQMQQVQTAHTQYQRAVRNEITAQSNRIKSIETAAKREIATAKTTIKQYESRIIKAKEEAKVVESGYNKKIAAARNYIKIRTNSINKLLAEKKQHTDTYNSMVNNINKMGNIDNKTRAQMKRAASIQYRDATLGMDKVITKQRQEIAAKNEAIRRFDIQKAKQAEVAKAAIANYDQEIAKVNASSAQFSVYSSKRVTAIQKVITKLREKQTADNINATNAVNKIQKEIDAVGRLETARRVANEKEEARVATQQAKAMKRTAAGGSLVAAGAVSMAGGNKIVDGINTATDAWLDYDKLASRSLTQVDQGIGMTRDKMVQWGQDIASDFAVPIEDTQESLYDLFSSMEFGPGKTNSLEDAKVMLEQVAIAAVGGATDMNTAGESLVGIMNSYDVAVKDSSKVNDLMFRLVKEGVGDYQEMANAMGIAGPSARNAGQDFQETAAMIALMTRHGQKIGRVGTFAARAFDQMTVPKVAKNFKELGVSVFDSSGKLRNMSDIVRETKNALGDMNDEQRTAAVDELFKGGRGSIQARKFFNAALTDTSGLYQQLNDDMRTAGEVMDENGNKVGAAKVAYDELASADMNQIIISSNKLQVAIQEIGEVVAPIKASVMGFFGDLAEKFSQLSPEAKDTIVKIAGVIGILMIVAGAIMAIVGAVLLFSAAGAMVGGLMVVVAPVLAVVAAVATLAAIAYIVYANWDTISAWFMGIWANIEGPVNDFVATLQAGWDQIAGKWEETVANFQPGIDSVISMFTYLKDQSAAVIEPFLLVLGGIWTILSNVISNILPGLSAFFSGIIQLISANIQLIVAIFTGDWGKVGEIFNDILYGILNVLRGFLSTVIGFFYGLIKSIIDFFLWLWDELVGHSIVPDIVKGVIKWFSKLPGDVIKAVTALIGQMVKWAVDLGTKVKTEIENKFKSVIDWFKDLPNKIKNAIGSLSNLLKGAGESIINGLWNGMKKIWDDAKNWVSGIADWISKNKGPVSVDLHLLEPHGAAIFKGFNKKLAEGIQNTKSLIGEVAPMLQAETPSSVNYRNVDGFGGSTFKMDVHTQEINPEKHSAELASEIRKKLGL